MRRGTALGVGLLLVGLGCNRVEVRPVGNEGSAPGPNVLLVTIDTLRADHVGAYGAPDAHTPGLDRIADQGVRFATAIASAPLTLPSHASILTGLYPPAAGVRHNGLYRLEPDIETLAERLRGAGYATGAFVGSFVLAARFGLDQGFQTYDDDMPPVTAGPGGFLERRAELVTDRALAWLERTDAPFFAWVHYYDPHATYRPPPPFSRRFADRPYAGEIAYVDSQIERLLAALRDTGRLEHTVVAVTADHGESLGEHDEADHGYSLYDAVLAVPLLLRGPNVPVGQVVEGLARTVDLAPTLLALLDLAPLAGIDGRSLVPLWTGGGAPERPAYAETLATRLEVGWSPLFAVRGARFHYVRAPRPELYELASDPDQLRNLLELEPERAGPIAERLDAEIDRQLARERAGGGIDVDAETLAKLRALGYDLPESPATRTEPAGEALDPKDGRRSFRHLAAANEAYANDDFERATALLARALEEMPDSSRAHALLGFIHMHRGQARLARPHLESAVRLNPLSAYYRALLGAVRAELGDAEGAIRDYRAAAALDPAEPYAQLGLMWERARASDFRAAEAHAQQAAAGAPADVVVLVRIGDVWSRFGQYGRAGAAFEAAVRVDPSAEYPQMRLAIELARFGMAAQSDAHRARAGALAEDPELARRLALAHAAGGDTARAESLLRTLLERHPDWRPARLALERLRPGQGREAPPPAAAADF